MKNWNKGCLQRKGAGMEIHESIIAMIENSDRAGANRLMEEWAAEHGYERLVVDVLGPVLKSVGEKWQEEEELSLAHAYLASKIAEDALQKLCEQKCVEMPEAKTKGPVVLGNIEDDFHGMGRRMVSIFLQADGWTVHDLGNDVEPKNFVDKAIEVGAKVIGVSAMMYSTAEHIRRVRLEIDSRGLNSRIQLAVGGAIFVLRPELVKEFDADGTAQNALGASELFTLLWSRANRKEDGDE